MIHKDTLRYSLYATFGIVILTLTGIFSAFETRTIIRNTLYFDHVVLTLMLGGAAFLVALRVRERGLATAIVNGVVGSLVVAVTLAVIVLLVETKVNDIRFVLQNLPAKGLNSGTLTFRQSVSFADKQFTGLLYLLLFSAGTGVAAGWLVTLPQRAREVLLIVTGLTVIFGLTVQQINAIIALTDALMLVFVFAVTYYIGWKMTSSLTTHLAVGFAVGVGVGIVLAMIANNGGLENHGVLRGSAMTPKFLGMTLKGTGMGVFFLVLMGGFGMAGMLVSGASRNIHNASSYFFTTLLVLGVLNWQGYMTLLAAGIVWGILCLAFWIVPRLGERSDSSFATISREENRAVNVIFMAMALLVLLVAPQFMGLYLSNVFNLIALYAIMGLGLNVMIGYAGLLDLGYVASFAIGAYTLGILTTPNLATCGWTHPKDIPMAEIETTCKYVIDFWPALPFCVLFSALTGALLGIPVLRLRGDYLAIVTLGFGEIINRVIKSNTFKPLLGGPQGISPIPSPRLDFTALHGDWAVTFSNSTSIYYLFLFGVAITVLVIYRLSGSRLGRAWRAVRADEDVAQAVGIDLVRTKLWAFGISSSFAGLGGAIFGGMLQGIFPDSFTLLISINVLSLIIIGGMGSITGVLLGAMLLVGLPELLRELEAYRMLAFGALLVTVMLIKPEGLLPPKPPRLSEQVSGTAQTEGER